MCVLIFSITFVWNISHSKKKWVRHYQKCTVRAHPMYTVCPVSLSTVGETSKRIRRGSSNQIHSSCRSKWPRGLRSRSAAARLLGLWVRIPPGHGRLSVVSVVCCQVEVSATSWPLVQRSPTDCGASLCVIYKPRHTQSLVIALR